MANFSPDDLREIESLTRSIGRSMDDLSNRADQRNRKLAQELSIMKSITSELNSEEDIQKALEGLERRRNIILNTRYGVNRNLKQELIDQNIFATKALKLELSRLQIISKVAKAASEVGDAMQDGISTLKQNIDDIPVLGKVFNKLIPYDSINAGIDKMTSGFTRGFRTMFTRNLSQGKGFVQSFKGGMTAGMGQVSKVITPLLTNPYTAAAIAITALVAIGVLGFYKLSEAVKAFREETGLLNSQTQGLEQNIINVSKTTASLGASTQDVAKAAAEFTNTFDGLEQPSQAVLSSIVVLNKNFGVSVTEATKLNKIFQNIGDLTAEQAQALIGQTVEMAKMVGVAPDKVIKDMADNSEFAYKYFGGSVQELRNAAIQAAKLGTSLAEAGKVADNLLDFESSITKELEASVILGQSLNFGQARYLASTKDVLGAQQAVLDEVMKLGDVTQLNVWEQEALVEASGMTLDSLANQQRIRERFGRLNKEDLAAALSLVEAGQDITKLSEADLKNQTKKLAEQKEMQSQFDNMKNQLSAIGTDLLMALAPIGKLFVGILVPVFSLLKGFFVGVGKALTNLMSAFDNLLAPFREIFGDSSGEGFLKTLEFIGEIISASITYSIRLAARVIDAIANTIGGVFKIIKGIFTLDFSLIGEGILQLLKGVAEAMYAPFLATFDFVVGLFDSFLNIFSDMGQRIKATITNMIPDWVKDLIGVGGVDITSSVQNQKQSSMSTTGPSINDGVVQNGQVVSTHPDDFLIATKNPAQLANSVSGGGVPMISMDGVIAELRELKAAFLSNKDVYMDSTKVTTIVRRKTETSTDNKFGTQFA